VKISDGVAPPQLIGIDDPTNPYYIWLCPVCERSYHAWMFFEIETVEDQQVKEVKA
jgi:hypothetical protein